MLNDKTKKNTSLKKGKIKQANLGETSKPGLISQTRNQWNLRRGLNQEAWFPTNLMLKDEIEKKTI
jgi:hypothetical protein